MADYIYLDTSALGRWACGTAGSPAARDQAGKANLEGLIAGDDYLVGSPITIAEFSSVLHTLVRENQDWGGADFDLEAADAVEAQLMQWLAGGEIKIRDLGPKAFEMGMVYVASANREHARKMRAWDAIHLYEACRWSRELDQQIAIATSDKDFAKFIELFSEFGKHVRVLDITDSP